jgi:NADP-dependent 3-hydroxy acid dehydrogenase YdfG
MNLQLTEKSALITGSTAGIGFAIARTLPEKERRLLLPAVRRIESMSPSKRFNRKSATQRSAASLPISPQHEAARNALRLCRQ